MAWSVTGVNQPAIFPAAVVTTSRRLLRLWEMTHISRFQTWPAGNISYGVYPDFAFHTCTTQRELLCTDASQQHNKSSTLLRQEVEQPGDRKWRINSEMMRSSWQHTDNGVSSYHHKLSWHLCLCPLRVCVSRSFHREIFVSFLFFFNLSHLSRVASSNPSR